MTNHPRARSSFAAAGALAAVCALAACDPSITVGDLPLDGSPSTGAGASDPQTETETEAAGITTLATVNSNPEQIAYAGQFLFVGSRDYHVINGDTDYPTDDTSDVVRIPLAGGAPVAIVEGVTAITSIAANDDYLYFGCSDATLRRVPVSGGTTEVIYQGDSSDSGPPKLDSPWSLALDGTDVYWSNGRGAVMRFSTATASTTEVLAAVPNEGHDGLRIDGDRLYWVQRNDDSFYTIESMPLAGGAPTALFDVPWTSSNFIPRGDYIYVSDGGGTLSGDDQGNFVGVGTITRFRIDQSEPPTVLASEQGFPSGMAIDDSGIYWGGGDHDGGPFPSPPPNNNIRVPINRLSPGGGGTQEVLVPTSVVYLMTPCANGICWVDSSTGDVRRFDESTL